MFEAAFVVSEYERGRPFAVDEVEVTALKVLHYDLDAYGFRVSANGTVLAYSGDSGPSDALAELARDADLFVCEATLEAPNPEGGTRGHLAADEADDAFRVAGAKRLLLTHRPSEREPRRALRAGPRRLRARFPAELVALSLDLARFDARARQRGSGSAPRYDHRILERSSRRYGETSIADRVKRTPAGSRSKMCTFDVSAGGTRDGRREARRRARERVLEDDPRGVAGRSSRRVRRPATC